MNNSFINSLSGKKTYIVAILMVIYALSGYFLHYLTPEQMWTILFNAGAFAGLRNGISSLKQ